MISQKEFINRRVELFSKIKDCSVLILFAGLSKKMSADEDYDFYCNRNFYYYTNILQEGSIYIGIKLDDVVTEYLFISPYDELKEKWTGKRLSKDEAIEKSGIDNILYLDSFNPKLSIILDRETDTYGNINYLYMDYDQEQKIAYKKGVEDFQKELSSRYNYLKFVDIFPFAISQRMVKSLAEIKEFKEAVKTTDVGLKKLIKSVRPGLYEYQLSSLFYYTVQDHDYSALSFPTICGSGVHGACLHYTTPLDKLKDGDLVLFDLGAKHDGYCADISRTYPINGKFNPLQKTIYEIVLGCNKMVISIIKPGIRISEIQEKVVDYLALNCLNAKLINNKEEIKNYYFHNISHHIGLDTHDISDRSLPLVPGNIISDEPGLYFKDLGIGIRIEDDILVTDDGCVNLSAGIIKEVDDIEKAMSKSEKN